MSSMKSLTYTITTNLMSQHPQFEVMDQFWKKWEVSTSSDAESLLVSDSEFVNSFVEFLLEKDILCNTMKPVITDELRTSTRSTLFRESSLGMAVLSNLWYKSEGRPFLEATLVPLVNSLASAQESLEIDPLLAEDKHRVKKNVNTILEAVYGFLQRVYKSYDLFPEKFKIILRGLDNGVSVRFADVGSSILAGVLFLRLINPAVVFPQNYGFIEKDKLTGHGLRALVIVSKILQNMANETEFSANKDPQLVIANRFMKRQMPDWRTYFHKLMTGSDLVEGATNVTFEISPEDLVAKSNHDIYAELTCPKTLSKQREMISHMFTLEKQMQRLEQKAHKLYSNSFERFKGTSKAISKLNSVMPVPLADIYEHLKVHTCRAIGLKEPVLIHQFNDQLTLWYSVIKMPFPFQPRDFLVLQYAEILPEDNFAIIASTSIDLSNDVLGLTSKLQFEPNCVRGEITAGYILRAGPEPGTTSFTQIKHLDLGGSVMEKWPTSFMKKQVLSKQKKVFLSHYEWAVQVADERKRLSEKQAAPQMDDKRKSASNQPSSSFDTRETISVQ